MAIRLKDYEYKECKKCGKRAWIPKNYKICHSCRFTKADSDVDDNMCLCEDENTKNGLWNLRIMCNLLSQEFQVLKSKVDESGGIRCNIERAPISAMEDSIVNPEKAERIKTLKQKIKDIKFGGFSSLTQADIEWSIAWKREEAEKRETVERLKQELKNLTLL